MIESNRFNPHSHNLIKGKEGMIMKKKQRFLGSISGGRSSVRMMDGIIKSKNLKAQEVWLGGFYLYTKYVNDTEEWIFVFANTSREKEATLRFMKDVDTFWGYKITWVEAVVDFRKNKGTKHKVVTFETAKRKSEIFEDVIKKYGIPNHAFPHCTREMKQAAIRSFMTYIGWGSWKDYKTVIGYRIDEPKRNSFAKAEILNQWYPLTEWRINKADIAVFWNRQSFDLGIEVDADGNCEDCWKKSDLKIIYQCRVNPEGGDWVRKMQSKFQYYTAGRDVTNAPPPYNFFRHNRTLDDIIDEYPELKDKSIDELKILLNDKSLSEDGANYDLLEQEDCAESCEPFTEYEN